MFLKVFDPVNRKPVNENTLPIGLALYRRIDKNKRPLQLSSEGTLLKLLQLKFQIFSISLN